MKFDHFSIQWDQKTVFYRQKIPQKNKILSVEILLRRICQKSMSNDACNFVISYIVCKINKYFTKINGQKCTSFGKNILLRQSTSFGHSSTGHPVIREIV